MKRSIIRLLMAFVLMNLFCFTLAIAEPVDDYVKFKEEKYYLLDKENFSKITCKVKVPIIDNMLENIKAQLKSRANVVQINENVSDFTMTYLRGEEIKFNKPYFDIKVISPEGSKIKNLFMQVSNK